MPKRGSTNAAKLAKAMIEVSALEDALQHARVNAKVAMGRCNGRQTTEGSRLIDAGVYTAKVKVRIVDNRKKPLASTVGDATSNVEEKPGDQKPA